MMCQKAKIPRNIFSFLIKLCFESTEFAGNKLWTAKDARNFVAPGACASGRGMNVVVTEDGGWIYVEARAMANSHQYAIFDGALTHHLTRREEKQWLLALTDILSTVPRAFTLQIKSKRIRNYNVGSGGLLIILLCFLILLIFVHYIVICFFARWKPTHRLQSSFVGSSRSASTTSYTPTALAMYDFPCCVAISQRFVRFCHVSGRAPHTRSSSVAEYCGSHNNTALDSNGWAFSS